MTRSLPRTVAVGAAITFAAFALSCSGPQPLSVAIDPIDQEIYVEYLNAADLDAKLAFARWMADQRETEPDDVLSADAELSTTRNPFDAHRDKRSVSRGAVIFKMHCARCHGEDASGNGPSLLPDHPTIDFHTFGQRFASTLHRGAPRRWFRVISDGSGDEVDYPDGRNSAMPAFGNKLAREQIWLVITYLQSLDMHAGSR